MPLWRLRWSRGSTWLKLLRWHDHQAVVRIMDYGKYKFEMAKQARQAKKKQHVILLK